MRAGQLPKALRVPATGSLPPSRAVAARSIRTAAAALVTTLATALGSSAVAQQRLDTLVIMRIEDDRSNVCIHALQIDLDALPSQRLGSGCATRRTDPPPFDARFEIGSISKALVGVLAAEMAARGEVRLDEPMSALLPAGVAAPQISGAPITLADLLTHTSGLPRLPVGTTVFSSMRRMCVLPVNSRRVCNRVPKCASRFRPANRFPTHRGWAGFRCTQHIAW